MNPIATGIKCRTERFRANVCGYLKRDMTVAASDGQGLKLTRAGDRPLLLFSRFACPPEA